MIYKGALIEESLEKKSILNKIKITKTEIIPVTEKMKTPWVKQWTFHYINILENNADNIAKDISKSLDSKHTHAWYVDFKNSKTHFVIFKDKVFKIDRKNKEKYNKAVKYGLKIGIPNQQLDFSPFKS
jgi:hypothetical protein